VLGTRLGSQCGSSNVVPAERLSSREIAGKPMALLAMRVQDFMLRA